MQLQLKDYASEHKPRGVWYDDVLIRTESLLNAVVINTARQHGRMSDIQMEMVEASIRISQKALKKITLELLDGRHPDLCFLLHVGHICIMCSGGCMEWTP